MQVRGNEERVVVQHLLEVRHGPLAVDRVAVEAAADEVVHPAGGHGVERALGHLSLVATQEKLEHRRRWELRCAAEASPDRVERRPQRAHRIRE